MSPHVGQLERKTQNRIVELFRDRLRYDYLGNWEERDGNNNVEGEYLRTFLSRQGYSDSLVTLAVETLDRAGRRNDIGLYDANKEFYQLLRYGVKGRETHGARIQDINVIDWKNPGNNHFAFAEEVTVKGNRTKRPDIVLYVNGIAIGVIELKRSTVSVAEGIRQNIGNQEDEFIRPFFNTIQVTMAGNDTEGLRYGTTQTNEKHYLTWKEDGYESDLLLDRHILQLCDKAKLLEIMHDFIVFDSGIKKTCRPNQYFGVKAAQPFTQDHKSGIIWHTQGSGKSLTMVWLAQWIREHVENSRVLILTDRTELDEQIEKVFNGVNKDIYRTRSCADLIAQLGNSREHLMCSLVQKFGQTERMSDEATEKDIDRFVRDLQASAGTEFASQGDIFVFVDECHRTHTGKLHQAMQALLPQATFIGFTGTPLLKVDKHNSVVVWGPYIHTYKYDEAVKDGVVLDLLYEARRVPQQLESQDRVDAWFAEKTKGLTDVAKAELKRRWGTMQTLLSSSERLSRVVFDILDDFDLKTRLESGRGNAILVAGSIAEACRYYELFEQQGFTKCAVITSYGMSALQTQEREYAMYQRMLDAYRKEYGAIEQRTGESEVEAFERVAKERFIKYPGQMRLLIVVDKLLTGFDAPPATYLYIDKNMQDHKLFQAICRVNRVDTEDKEYGYIVDYRDLFSRLEQAVTDYTAGALENFDRDDILGLVQDRLTKGRKDLDEALEAVSMLCEPVEPPRDSAAYFRYFCGDVENPYSLKDTEFRRVKLYKSVSHLLRVYAELANDMSAAGYDEASAKYIASQVGHYENAREEIRLASGDHIDLKQYEPDMRRLIDKYVRAGASERLTSFNDMSLVDLLIERGEDALTELPESIKRSREATAETIENNVRKLIIDETPTNPRYYQQMSTILAELIAQRKREDVEYDEYLKRIMELSKKVRHPEGSGRYPARFVTRAQQALYDNLGEDENKALTLDGAIQSSLTADWRGHPIRERRVRNAIQDALDCDDAETERIFAIVLSQHDY